MLGDKKWKEFEVFSKKIREKFWCFRKKQYLCIRN